MRVRADTVRRVKSSRPVRADLPGRPRPGPDPRASLRRLLTGLLVCLAIVAALALSAAPPSA